GAVPGDDEVAGRVQADRHEGLVARRELVDLELRALGRPGGVVSAGNDAVATAAPAVTLPGHDEIAGGVRRHRRTDLFTGGGLVDQDLRAEWGAVGTVAPGEDVGAAASGL